MIRECDICGDTITADMLVGDETGIEKYRSALVRHYETAHPQLLYVINCISKKVNEA